MRFLQSSRVAIVLLALPLLLLAEPVSQLHPTDYVNDFAHVLDPTTIAQLDNICQQLDQKAHAQIAAVTVNTLDGSDIESYAVALYKQWGIGSKATDHGVLILLAVQDRKYRIEVGYGLEPILPDGKVGGIGREAVPLLRQSDYSGAVSLMTSRVADVIAQDAGIELTGARPQLPAAPSAQPQLSGKQLLILGVILLIVLLTPLRKILFYFLLLGEAEVGVGMAAEEASEAVAAALEDLAEAAPAGVAPAAAGSLWNGFVAPASRRLSRGHPFGFAQGRLALGARGYRSGGVRGETGGAPVLH